MKNFTETVRHTADIVRVISDYVTLKGTGTSLKAPCPFHSEKTPSFFVHREKQIFHCFGCGEGGDVFKFVMLAEKVSFPEAVKIVAEKSGIPVPAFSPADARQADERRDLFELNERAAVYFAAQLNSPEAFPARQVLSQREVQPASVQKFRLGFAPAAGLLRHLHPADPANTGLFVRNERGETYDRFRHRLMFPICNERGKVIAFGGRILGDGQPKYLNSPESPLYSKSHVLYALHLARAAAQKAGRMIVVEGYFDCLSLHQAGVENVVASCGTSLTPQQVAILSRQVPEVVMNYDPDAAGQSAMKRSIDLLLAKGLRIRVLKLPGGLDPDDFVRRNGAEVYQRLLDAAPYFWDYLVDEASSRYDLSRPESKATAVREVVQAVSGILDKIERVEVARAVAGRFRVSENVVLEQVGAANAAQPAPMRERTVARVTTRRELSLAEKQVIHALMQDPGIADQLREFLSHDFLKGVWSGSVLQRWIDSPTLKVEEVLEGVDDSTLRAAVRGAVLEPFGQIEPKAAVDSMAQLYLDHLVEKSDAVRKELQAFGAAEVPSDLLRQQMKIEAEKSRIRAIRAAGRDSRAQ